MKINSKVDFLLLVLYEIDEEENMFINEDFVIFGLEFENGFFENEMFNWFDVMDVDEEVVDFSVEIEIFIFEDIIFIEEDVVFVVEVNEMFFMEFE